MKTLNNTSLMDLADTRNITSSTGSANGSGCLTVNILQNQNDFYLDTPLIDILNYATENKGAVIAHYDPSQGHYADNVFYLIDFGNSPYTRFATFKCDHFTDTYNNLHSLETKNYFKVTQSYGSEGFLPETYKMSFVPLSEMVITVNSYGNQSSINSYTVKEIYDHAHSGKNVILFDSGTDYHYMLSQLNFQDDYYVIDFTKISGPATNGNTLSFDRYRIASSDPTATAFTYSSYGVPLAT